MPFPPDWPRLGVLPPSPPRFAALVGVSSDRVAIGNQVSTFSGLVAAALPDGARVLAAEEDFSLVLFHDIFCNRQP